MALVAQEIPKVGLVMEAVKVVRWLKNVGDTVTAGEPLLEVETEKSVVEIEAAASGRLAEILVQADSEARSATRSPGSSLPSARRACARRLRARRYQPRATRPRRGARSVAHPQFSGRPQTRRRNMALILAQ